MCESLPKDELKGLAVEGFELGYRGSGQDVSRVIVRNRGTLHYTRFVPEARIESKLAVTASLSVCHGSASNTKEPEPILRRLWHSFKAAPGDSEDLGNHVIDLVSGNSTRHVCGDVAKEQ